MSILDFIWQYRIWAFFLALVGLAGSWPMIWHYWWWYFRDADLFHFLSKRQTGKSQYGGRVFHPASVEDIAQALGCKTASVEGSLKRLRKGKRGEPLVVETAQGWYTKENAPKDLLEHV